MMHIRVAARDSPLSRAQVAEFFQLLQKKIPELSWITYWVKTRGDLDRTTSLRTLDQGSFFTDAVDQMVIDQTVDLGIHSAKDLPAPLPSPLKIIALTESLDPRDSLVLRPYETPAHGFCIATSSPRREEAVSATFPSLSLRFKDLRGTIQERLHLLLTREADGVVVAEAALLRLKLNPPRIYLLGPTTPLQGCIAATTHEHNEYIHTIPWKKFST